MGSRPPREEHGPCLPSDAIKRLRFASTVHIGRHSKPFWCNKFALIHTYMHRHQLRTWPVRAGHHHRRISRESLHLRARFGRLILRIGCVPVIADVNSDHRAGRNNEIRQPRGHCTRQVITSAHQRAHRCRRVPPGGARGYRQAPLVSRLLKGNRRRSQRSASVPATASFAPHRHAGDQCRRARRQYLWA